MHISYTVPRVRAKKANSLNNKANKHMCLHIDSNALTSQSLKLSFRCFPARYDVQMLKVHIAFKTINEIRVLRYLVFQHLMKIYKSCTLVLDILLHVWLLRFVVILAHPHLMMYWHCHSHL